MGSWMQHRRRSILHCYMLKEYLDDKPQKVQIFATDLSEPATQKHVQAFIQRAGGSNKSPTVAEFFIKTDGSYQVKKHIREMCVFAVHNF